MLSFTMLVTTAASIELTSNVERGERHLACPGQVVVFTCTATETSSLLWDSNRFQLVAEFGIPADSVGTVIDRGVMGRFTANLTQVVPDVVGSTLTATLTFTVTDSLNGTSVKCVSLEQSMNATLNIVPGKLFQLLHKQTIYISIPLTCLHRPTISSVSAAQCVRVWCE